MAVGNRSRKRRKTVFTAARGQGSFHFTKGEANNRTMARPGSSNCGQKTRSGTKAFDVDIERICENWESNHAVREITINAVAQEVLSGTKPVRVFQEDGDWHGRDYGHGLRYEHLTQKENDEKLKAPRVIGKFAIGVKDALPAFSRQKVKVVIRSRYGDVTIGKSQ
jgi:hypothetical protein